MLGKLFKYDFKWINKVMYVYFVILVLLSIAVKIVESVDQSLLLLIVDKIISAMFIGCVVLTIITCIMRTWYRFINNVYKDESYLTHTLPVTKNQILNSKILAGIASLLLSTFVIVICIAFVYLNGTTIYHIKNLYQSLVDAYNGVFAVVVVIGFILILLLEIIYFMMTGIFAIIVGHCSNNSKMIKSIAVGIGSYSVLSVVSLIVVSIVSSIIDYDIIGNVPTMNYIKVLGIVAIMIYLVYNMAYYFVIRRILNKGVNVE